MHSGRQFLLIAALLLGRPAFTDPVQILLPRQALAPDDIAVVINEQDPLSVRIGEYYAQRRGIPAANILRMSFTPGTRNLPGSTFAQLYQQMLSALPEGIQAFALTWARPYKVDCQSITTAFATGFDKRFCQPPAVEKSCRPTAESGLYGSDSWRPFNDHALRPAMSIAANSFDDARKLIDRGIASDSTFPDGTVYLLKTGDNNRNRRSIFAETTADVVRGRAAFEYLEQDALIDRHDVLAYFTGATRIDGLETLDFLPGAVADHLTSAGGHMPADDQSQKQMSSLRWLEAGATGSYGTVVEPCNFVSKFANPAMLMKHYLNGSTLIEAYWKSVASPGEGIFIGEPLARPFGQDMVTVDSAESELKLQALTPGIYNWQHSSFPVGPYADTGQRFVIGYRGESLGVSLTQPYYRAVFEGKTNIPLTVY